MTYHVEESRALPRGWRIVDDTGLAVDTLRVECAARRAAGLLTAGLAHIEARAVLGCRVVPFEVTA